MYWEIIILINTVLGAVGGFWASHKNRHPMEGFGLGFLLGPIGLGILAFLKKKGLEK